MTELAYNSKYIIYFSFYDTGAIGLKEIQNYGVFAFSHQKDLVINNIECGTHDEKLKLYFNKDENKQNNSVKIQKKFEDYKLQQRYEELIKAVNNNMPLSFFWLAGSIIEGVLCEYCEKNNIKSSKDDIDGYITALENNNKISKGSTIYTTLQHFRLFRNTIHPNNQNNDFISDKNLQNRKEDLDDVIKFFLG